MFGGLSSLKENEILFFFFFLLVPSDWVLVIWLVFIKHIKITCVHFLNIGINN